MIMVQLTQAILDALKNNGLDVKEIGFKDLIDGTINLTRPAVNITINTASTQRVTLFTYKYKVIVSLIIVFPYLKGGPEGEARRKAGVYDLIVSISNFIQGQKFGLPLENYITMNGFRNITTATYAKAGYQIYNLDFWTSFNVDATLPEYADQGTISSILADYWVIPTDSTSFTTPSRAEDLIELS
jgi:hypothetical protein